MDAVLVSLSLSVYPIVIGDYPGGYPSLALLHSQATINKHNQKRMNGCAGVTVFWTLCVLWPVIYLLFAC